MGFTFHVTFSGLLDFIPNGNPGKKVKMCAVLPEASNHDARISPLTGVELTLGGQKKGKINFDGRRVFFRITKGDGAPLEPVDFTPMLNGAVLGAIPFHEIAGPKRAAQINPEVVGENASGKHKVRAQILIQEGRFGVLAPKGPAKLTLPGTAEGTVKKDIEIAPFSFVKVQDVTAVQIVTQPLNGSPGKEEVYNLVSDGGADVGILVSYVCPNAVSNAPKDDKDFGFHYALLMPNVNEDGVEAAENDPVPGVVTLPPFANLADPVPGAGPLRGVTASAKHGGIHVLNLMVGGCNCAPAGGNTMDYDLDAFLTPAAVAAAPSRSSERPGRSRSTPSEPTHP
jgi:hypothetical protein